VPGKGAVGERRDLFVAGRPEELECFRLAVPGCQTHTLVTEIARVPLELVEQLALDAA
jgi:hypothetical protein